MNEQMISKKNIKLYPIYKMFAWDSLFYYAIIFLFLTQVKGFTASQFLIIDSFYAISRILSQLFCIKIVDLFGKQKSLLLGNVLISINILLLILGNTLSLIFFVFFIRAIGYNLKSLCEPTILSDSIPVSSYSSKIYSKIDGKGNSFYYVFDALSSATTGFLYVLNPYIPMIMCFVCCLVSTIISLSFNEPISEKNCYNKNSTKFINYNKDIWSIFNQIIHSRRLKSLLIFSLYFYAILSVFDTLRSSILVDLAIPEQYFGIILAIMQILASISSLKQNWFHKKFRNRLLSWFSLSITSCFILTGLFVICNISFTISLICILFTIVLTGIIKGPYFTLIQKYFNSFSNPNVNTKIFAVKSLVENLGRVILSLFASFLLSITTTSYSFVIIGCIFFIIFIFLLETMKTTVGLNPEEYSEEDLIFSNSKD